MEQANILEIAQAFSNLGQVALWLGSDWTPPQNPDELELIASQDWVGVWSDSKDFTLAEKMERAWREKKQARQLILVPDTIEESLGRDFRFSDFAPYMFLNGRMDVPDILDEITRSDSRVDKVRELKRIQNSVLIIDGAKDCSDAFRIAQEAARRADQLRRIILLGFSLEACQEQTEKLTKSFPSLLNKIAVFPSRLYGLIKQVYSLTTEIKERVVSVGETQVDIVPLLRQEPPVTQDFSILTSHDITPTSLKNEDDAELLKNIIAGSVCPWRSIARGLVWDGRPELGKWRNALMDAINSIKENKKKVIVIDVEAEPGSGVTTLLSQLAVFAATQNCPTLFHLGTDLFSSYPRLRTFLTDLYRDVSGSSALVPAVIIFDVDSAWSDLFGTIDLLPNKLNRDGRRAVIIRTKQIPTPWATDYATDKPSKDMDYRRTDTPLRERILDSDALKFSEWFSQQYHKLNKDTLPPNWYQHFKSLSSTSGCPFLITVSLLLSEKYKDVAKLGERLISRLDRIVNAVENERQKIHANIEMEDVIGKSLHRQLRFDAPASVTRKDFYNLIAVLSALGCLRVSIPRTVLARLAGINPSEILTVTSLMERAGLVISKEHLFFGATDIPCETTYRTKPAAVQLVHHEYGRLLLEYVSQNRLQKMFDGIASEFIKEADSAIASKSCGICSINLLKPVFHALRPGDKDDKQFAEELVQRFLRVQKEKGYSNDDSSQTGNELRTYSRWQWQRRHDVLGVFDWLPAEMIKTSRSILHSRAITRAKCTFNGNPTIARPLYMKAEDDAIAALEVNENTMSDNPAHVLSTLGGIYVHWAQMEREHGDPEHRVEELDELADKTLKEAKSLLIDNNYAVYHLAVHKVNSAEYFLRCKTGVSNDMAGKMLAEALELLSREPEPSFKSEWDDLQKRIILLLGEKGHDIISNLKREHKMLGWAIEALCKLNGEFPRGADIELNPEWLNDAWQILEQGFSDVNIISSPIADLLRYAIFSALKERENDPAYDKRLEYIKPLQGTHFLEDDPIWQYDYGMLSYQNGNYEEGARLFRELRRGQRFFQIPIDRSVILTKTPQSFEPKQFNLQIQSVDERTGQGWGRIGYPDRFPDPVPFGIRAFRSRDARVADRATLSCHVVIRPAGPFAEPIINR